MFEVKEKGIVIVHDKRTKQCAEYLGGLVGDLSASGIPVNAVVIDAKKFKSYPAEQKTSKQKIIYIGDFPVTKIVADDPHIFQNRLEKMGVNLGYFTEFNTVVKNINHWKYDEFGICYGWHGNKAVISITKTLTESEFMDMAKYAEKEVKDYEVDMLERAKRKGWNPLKNESDGVPLATLAGIPLDAKSLIPLGVLAPKVAIAIFTASALLYFLNTVANKERLDSFQTREQQHKFAVLHFYFKHLPDFLGIDSDKQEQGE